MLELFLLKQGIFAFHVPGLHVTVVSTFASLSCFLVIGFGSCFNCACEDTFDLSLCGPDAAPWSQ